MAGSVLSRHQQVTSTFATRVHAFASGSPGSTLPCAQHSRSSVPGLSESSSAATLAPSLVLMTPISRQGHEGGAPSHQAVPLHLACGHSTHRQELSPSPCPVCIPRQLPPCCSCLHTRACRLVQGKCRQSSPCRLLTAGVPHLSVLALASWGTDSTASLAGTGRYHRLLIKMSFTGPLGDLN